MRTQLNNVTPQKSKSRAAYAAVPDGSPLLSGSLTDRKRGLWRKVPSKERVWDSPE